MTSAEGYCKLISMLRLASTHYLSEANHPTSFISHVYKALYLCITPVFSCRRPKYALSILVIDGFVSFISCAISN